MSLTFTFVLLALYLILGLFVLFRNPRSKTNIYFFLFVTALIVWILSNFYENEVPDVNIATNLLKIDFITAAFMAYFFLLFCRNFPSSRQGNIDSLYLFLPAFFFAIASIYNLVISNMYLDINGIHFSSNILYLPYTIYFIVYMMAGALDLIIKYKKTKSYIKIHILYVLIGFILSTSIGVITNLILPRIYDVSIEIGRIGIYGLLFFILFTSYAIIKHHLMDIRFIVVKSITYFFLFFTIILVYTFFIFIFGALVFKSFTGIEAYWASMIVALTIAFTIQPIKRVFTRWTDRIFFKDNYNFEELTSKLNEVATSTIVLPELLFKFLNSLMEKMRITRGALILIEKGKIYETESIGYKQAINLLPKEIKHLVNDNKTEVFDEIEEGDFSKDIMRSYNTSLILHLKTEGEIIGFLFLGEKKSGDIYSFQDIRVLEIITDQVALGIQNAKAYGKTQKFNLVLKAEIDRATKELRDVNDRLVQADKSKDEFISLASHEIRTPIAALEGYLSMLNLQKVDIKARDEIAKRSYESVERLSTLVKDLLDVSRIDQKRIKLNKQPTRLERLIQRAMEGFELQTRDKKIYIKFQKPEKMLPEANIDPERVGEVFNNLISNAIKYTYKGGITISLEEKDNMAQITVSDTGMGIPKNAISHLFQKFYQAETASSVLSNERGGTGLGLYISKNIVEMHGGKIWVESTEGKGTAFYFTLPLI